ncbi:Replication factor C subunit 3 [Citrus sinensis]|uniref:Replication factor C subunit 3 n=1 Tax=Citrus sinensis TaxID=2711 RepID=A0ACB8MGX6_CITSI|nr:Replication factor C subunit 3 [Citrus sinensis]
MFCLRCGIEIILKVSRCICCNYLIFPATSALALLSLRVTEQDCPHLLFYGPPGSGKKTLIMALLRQVFGPGAEKAGSRNIDLELTTLSSANHVELSPSDAGFQDRYVVREIVKVLEFIAKKEGLQLPSGFATRLAEKSNRSLRRAILSFETCRVQQYPFKDNQAIPAMDWEEFVFEIASDIMQEQSPKRLFQVRGKLYELLLNCVPPVVVLKRLLYELLKRLDAEIKHEVCHWAAYYVSISFQILFIVPLVDFPSPLECSAQAAYIQPPLIRANSDPVALHS